MYMLGSRKTAMLVALVMFLFVSPAQGQLLTTPSVDLNVSIQVNDDGSGTYTIETRASSVKKVLGSTNERNPINCPQSPPIRFPREWNAQLRNYEADNGNTCVIYIRITFASPQMLAVQLPSSRLGIVILKDDEFTVKIQPNFDSYVKSNYKVKAVYSIRVPLLQRFKPLSNYVQTGSLVKWTFNETTASLIEITGKVSANSGDEGRDRSDKNRLEEIKKEASEKIPKEWGEGEQSEKGEGWRWKNPDNPGDEVRIMKGDPNSHYPHQREDYVQLRENYYVIGKDGKRLSGGTGERLSYRPEAHIPFREWIKWSTRFKP